MKSAILISSFFLMLFSVNACGPKVSNVDDGGCYQIVGDEVIYTCRNDSPDNPRANTGYTGPYNPKALNLYRPGRFENLNSAPW